MKNETIPYNPSLKGYARELRRNATLSEVLLWKKIKRRTLGVQFHRQVPLLDFIVDFYCHEVRLAIEIDGPSHDYKYGMASKNQGPLERKGVVFMRFAAGEIKNNMDGIAQSLEDKIQVLLSQRNERLHGTENLGNEENTPLKSPRGNITEMKPHPKAQSIEMKATFPKKEKLKGKKRIEKLFAEGDSVAAYPLKLIYLKTVLPEAVSIQAGVAVSKKRFRGAVDRNRIKRLLRESYRLNKHIVFNNIEGGFAFLFLYLGNEMPSQQSVSRQMSKLLQLFLSKNTPKEGQKEG